MQQQGGVDYLFTVLGSDHPSIIEAYVRRQNILGKQFPRMILFQHEVCTSILCHSDDIPSANTTDFSLLQFLLQMVMLGSLISQPA